MTELSPLKVYPLPLKNIFGEHSYLDFRYIFIIFRDIFIILGDIFIISGIAEKKAVYNLWGSIFQWANEGRPMLDGNNQPAVHAHPFNPVFGKILKKELRKTEFSNM